MPRLFLLQFLPNDSGTGVSGPVATCPTKGRTHSGRIGRERPFKFNSTFTVIGIDSAKQEEFQT